MYLQKTFFFFFLLFSFYYYGNQNEVLKKKKMKDVVKNIRIFTTKKTRVHA